MDSLERRGGWLALAIGLVTVWNSLGFASYLGLETWEMVVFMTSMFCLVVALTLVVASVAPSGVVQLELARRERLSFWALTLFAAALILIATNAANGAFEAHERGGLGLSE